MAKQKCGVCGSDVMGGWCVKDHTHDVNAVNPNPSGGGGRSGRRRRKTSSSSSNVLVKRGTGTPKCRCGEDLKPDGTCTVGNTAVCITVPKASSTSVSSSSSSGSASSSASTTSTWSDVLVVELIEEVLDLDFEACDLDELTDLAIEVVPVFEAGHAKLDEAFQGANARKLRKKLTDLKEKTTYNRRFFEQALSDVDLSREANDLAEAEARKQVIDGIVEELTCDVFRRLALKHAETSMLMSINSGKELERFEQAAAAPVGPVVNPLDEQIQDLVDVIQAFTNHPERASDQQCDEVIAAARALLAAATPIAQRFLELASDPATPHNMDTMHMVTHAEERAEARKHEIAGSTPEMDGRTYAAAVRDLLNNVPADPDHADDLDEFESRQQKAQQLVAEPGNLAALKSKGRGDWLKLKAIARGEELAKAQQHLQKKQEDQQFADWKAEVEELCDSTKIPADPTTDDELEQFMQRQQKAQDLMDEGDLANRLKTEDQTLYQKLEKVFDTLEYQGAENKLNQYKKGVELTSWKQDVDDLLSVTPDEPAISLELELFDQPKQKAGELTAKSDFLAQLQSDDLAKWKALKRISGGVEQRKMKDHLKSLQDEETNPTPKSFPFKLGFADFSKTANTVVFTFVMIVVLLLAAVAVVKGSWLVLLWAVPLVPVVIVRLKPKSEYLDASGNALPGYRSDLFQSVINRAHWIIVAVLAVMLLLSVFTFGGTFVQSIVYAICVYGIALVLMLVNAKGIFLGKSGNVKRVVTWLYSLAFVPIGYLAFAILTSLGIPSMIERSIGVSDSKPQQRTVRKLVRARVIVPQKRYAKPNYPSYVRRVVPMEPAKVCLRTMGKHKNAHPDILNGFRVFGCEKNGVKIGMVGEGKALRIKHVAGTAIWAVKRKGVAVWRSLWGLGVNSPKYRFSQYPADAILIVVAEDTKQEKWYVWPNKDPMVKEMVIPNHTSRPQSVKIYQNARKGVYHLYGSVQTGDSRFVAFQVIEKPKPTTKPAARR